MNRIPRALLPIAGLLLTAWALPAVGHGLQVIVAPAKTERLADPIESLGTLRANESAALTATITETISEIRFADGERVNAGQVLVALTNREQLAELAAAEADLEEARRQHQRVVDLAERGQESRAVLDLRQRELNNAEARLGQVEARLSDRLITAPFDGVLGLRNVSVGSLLTPGTVVTTIQDDSVMKLDFAVPELFLARVAPGQLLRARSRAFPDNEFEGRVTSLSNTVDPVTRAFQVRAEIDNPDRQLKAGMLMTLTLESREREAITVPEEAILSRGREHHVFVVPPGASEVERRPVRLGSRHPGRVEIASGLQDGERVVVHGGFRLSDGDKVAVRAEVDDKRSLAAILAGDRRS